MYISEKYQLGMVAEFLREKEIEYITEGVLYSVPIDILGLQNGEVVSIELKSRDIKDGLAQAKRNMMFSDRVYVSVWEDQLSSNRVEDLEKSPIGMIAVEDDVSIVSEAKPINPNQFAKDVAVNVIRDGIRK